MSNSNYINNLFNDFTKIDTLLAFVVSFTLFYLFSLNKIFKNIILKSFVFSISFVIIFLTILNLINFLK